MGYSPSTADVPDSTNKRYVLDADLVDIGNLSGTNTGDQSLAGLQPIDADLTAIAALDSTIVGVMTTDGAGWIRKTYAAFKTLLVLVKGDVGLGSVDNTSDAGKPVSTAQQTALDLKANIAGPTFTGTVGGITKSMVGLGSVDNTADTTKPVSTAQQTALNLKQDTSGKDATGGYAGLTLFKINFKNAANTFTSFFTNTNTAAQTYTFPDRTGTIADDTDLALKAPKASPRFTGVMSFACAVVTGTAARTLTGAQMAAGSIQELTGTTARTFTLDTGTNLSAAVPGVQVGDAIQFIVKCSGTSTGTITMAGGTGTTLSSTAVIAIGTSRLFTAINTGTNTWTIY